MMDVNVVVVIMVGRGVELPGGAAESGGPIVGWLVRSFAVAPDEPIAMRGGAGRFGIEEPFVLVGGVVDDEIENDFYVALFAFGDETIEIRERAVHGIDIFVVGDVVAEIDLRGREARRNPDGVDAEVFEVIEFRGDALEVADAVVVAVGEAARIDLVEDGVLPPFVALGVDFLLLGGGVRDARVEEESEYCSECFSWHGRFLLIREAWVIEAHVACLPQAGCAPYNDQLSVSLYSLRRRSGTQLSRARMVPSRCPESAALLLNCPDFS